MDYKSQIIEIVKAQAMIRPMTNKDISEMIDHLTKKIDAIPDEKPEEAEPVDRIELVEGEDYVVCLECGKKVKYLASHLNYTHKMRTIEYRVKHKILSPSVNPEKTRKFETERKRRIREGI